MLQRLEYVVLLVRDITQVRDFYLEKLGLTLADRTLGGRLQNAQDASPQFVQFNLPAGHGATFALQADANAQPIANPALTWIVEDADAAHDELVRRGVEIVSAPADYPFGRELRIKDPAGNLIYLLQPAQR
jgi:predicted enzyme related to lactoylglutathione lyase